MEAAEKAVALAPNLADGYLARANAGQAHNLDLRTAAQVSASAGAGDPPRRISLTA